MTKSNLISSPLEQFEVFDLFSIQFSNFLFTFTNTSLYMLFAWNIISLMAYFSFLRYTIVPTRWQITFESMYEFILSVVKDNIGKKGFQFFPLVFVTFIFLLSCNLIGMIPYSFTVTSHIIITFGLGFSLFVGITLLGLFKHQLRFFTLFFPAGVPIAIAPLIVPIEVLSYLSRAFSLPIRLFANMMSGHALLKIIAGFAWEMITIGNFFLVAAMLPMAFLVILTGLELGVACIQAYVFSVLLCIYLNDAISLHAHD